jgi:hypothetical protein
MPAWLTTLFESGVERLEKEKPYVNDLERPL